MMAGSGVPSDVNSSEPDTLIPDPDTFGDMRCSASAGESIRTLSVMRFRPIISISHNQGLPGAYAVWPCGRNHEILTTFPSPCSSLSLTRDIGLPLDVCDMVEAGPFGGLVSSIMGSCELSAHMK